MSVVGGAPKRKPCLSNCETCNHKPLNDAPELHCYMFKDAPEGQCMQHTGMMGPFSDLVALLRTIQPYVKRTK